MTAALTRAAHACKCGDVAAAAYSPDMKWYALGEYSQLGTARTQLMSVTRP